MPLGNDVEPITIDGLDINVTTAETPRARPSSGSGSTKCGRAPGARFR
jgi:hypothetical protein